MSLEQNNNIPCFHGGGDLVVFSVYLMEAVLLCVCV